MRPSRPHPRRPKANSGESGYAMLLVFLIAAMIAIALYKEMPRVSFESQRDKEQSLIERGSQYKRAIQLFVRKMSRYPATIEELENTNNIRFLRKRYVDPMTGKDKWRLIHINGGVLTDSIIQKGQPGQPAAPQANTNTFIAEGPVMGATNDPNQQQNNPALRRRPSDDRPTVSQDTPPKPPAESGDDSTPPDPDANADTSGNLVPVTPGAAVPGAPNQQVPGMPAGRYPQPGIFTPGTNPGQPGQSYGTPGASQYPANPLGTVPGNSSQNSSSDSGSSVYVAPSLGQSSSTTPAAPTGLPVQPGYANQQNNPYPGQAGASGTSGYPGSFPNQPGGFPTQPGGFPQPTGFPGRPGMYPNQPNAFSGQPQSAFSGPTSGSFGQSPQSSGSTDPTGNNFGLNGPSNVQPQGLPGMGGQQMGGGIAGVASEATGPAIKIYNERKKYNEWEFVYDRNKDRGLAGVQGNGGALGTSPTQMGNQQGSMVPGQQGAGVGPGSTFNNNSSNGFSLSTPQQPQPQPQPQPQQPQN